MGKKEKKELFFILYFIAIIIGDGTNLFYLKGLNITPFRILFPILLIFNYKKIFLDFKGDKKYMNYFFYFSILFEIFHYFLDLINLRDNRNITQIWYLLIGYITFSYIASSLKEKRDLKKLKRAILVSLGLVFIVTLLNLFWGIQINNILIKSYLINSPIAFFGNQNALASYLIMNYFILDFIISNDLLKKILKLFIIGIVVICKSRISIIALIIVIFFNAFKSINVKKIRKNFLITMTVIILAFLIFGKIKNNTFIEYSMRGLKYQIKNIGETNSDKSRGIIYEKLLETFVKSPLIGIGRANISWELKKANISPPNPHNWTLEILTAYGILCFILYYIFILKMITTCFIKGYLKKNKRYKDLLFALILFNFGGLTNSSYVIFKPQWLFLGVIYGIFQILEGSEKRSGKNKNIDCNYRVS